MSSGTSPDVCAEWAGYPFAKVAILLLLCFAYAFLTGHTPSVYAQTVSFTQKYIFTSGVSEISVAATSPDGMILAVGGTGGTVEIWNMMEGVKVTIVNAHSGRVAFIETGVLLVRAGTGMVAVAWAAPGAPVAVDKHHNYICGR